MIEDTNLTLHDLRRESFSEDVLEALDRLTRRQGENYEEFIMRVATNRLNITVKLADLEDNCDLSRLEVVKPDDLERLQKDRHAIGKLLELQYSNHQCGIG